MTRISKRTQSLGTENAFVVLAEVNALARQGKDIISFCIGQPDFPAPLHVQEAGIRAIREGKHGYTPSAGIDPLREAAAKYLAGMRGGLPIRAQDVVVGAGAKPFIAYAILSTTDHGAGDEVIYPNPGFPIYESQITACGARAVPIHLHEAKDFAFDLSDLERVITPKTKLLILNYPHNPTGWRIGFTSNPALAPVFTRWITNTDSCASQISQWAAVEAINGPQDAAEMMKKSFLERRDLIVRLLNDVPGVKCRVPGGAFYAWPNVTEACRMIGAPDSEEFRKRLLHEAGVAVLADIHFGARVPGEGQHVRFSYAASREQIEQGVARMEAFIRKNTRKAA